MNSPTRSFHLSCMGPLDPASPGAERAERLAGFISDPRKIRRILMATPHAPQAIMPARPTLADARALDAALLSIGILSAICYIDSHEPQVARLFIDQREGARRSEQRPITPVDQRQSRGRRALDRA